MGIRAAILATGSLEIAHPLLTSMPSLWGALFVDAGNAYHELKDKPYIIWKLPDTPPPDLDLRPQGQVRWALELEVQRCDSCGYCAGSTSPMPNGGTSIRIRGSRSFKANQEPLFVLDGMPQSNGSQSLMDLDPHDIKSIEVLCLVRMDLPQNLQLSFIVK